MVIDLNNLFKSPAEAATIAGVPNPFSSLQRAGDRIVSGTAVSDPREDVIYLTEADILKTKEFVNSQIHVKFLEENFEIRELEEDEVISDRPNKVNISLEDSANPTLAPQRPKKIGMDLTGSIKNPGLIFAEMQGTIMETMTKQGKKVKKGDSLFVLEAMKMENVITSPIDGVIKTFNITKGQAVKKDDLLVEIEVRF